MSMKYRSIYGIAILLIVLSWSGNLIFGELPELLSRESFFGGSNKNSYSISPDGKYISYIAPTKKGALGLWVCTPGKSDDRLLSGEEDNIGLVYYWAYDNKHILYLADTDGDENFHLFTLDITTGKNTDLTPYKIVKAQNLLLKKSRPGEVLVGLNLRDSRQFDMYRINLETGKSTKEVDNPGDVRWWLSDENLVIRAAVAISPKDCSTTLRVRDGEGKPWKDLIVWPFGETGVLEGYGSDIAIAFTADGKAIFVQAAFEGDQTQLAKVDATTGKVLKIISSRKNESIWNQMGITLYNEAQLLFSPKTGEVQAVGFNYLKPSWEVIDPALKDDFSILEKNGNGVFSVLGRDLLDTKWVILTLSDIGDSAYYYLDRTAHKLEKLAELNPGFSTSNMAPMEPIVIKSRDGLDIPCYITYPKGVSKEKLPLVVMVHGGPWARDDWGFDPFSQYLANRGYAVLKVNFRGSAGFGKKFLNAGIGQWGAKMQDDITDAVKYFIGKGIADEKRIGIIGGSYGGYATLAGVTFTPDLYNCAICMSGISNVKTFMESMPDWWGLIKKRWLMRIGNVLEDDEMNRRISPVFHTKNIKAKLMIIHGEKDPRVKISEADQIVKAMRENKQEVVYVMYPDEGHGGTAHAANLLDTLVRIEEFLGQYLGGRVQPRGELPPSSVILK